MFTDDMAAVSQYVAVYGYLAIFLLVFLQEIGVPNPVTNELVLLYSGYLAYTGVLSIIKIIGVTVAADFTGTCLLYFVFYAFGGYIIRHKPRWLPISTQRVDVIKQCVYKGRGRAIYFGRLIPFLRGYVSVGAGVVRVKPSLFLPVVLTSALSWSGGLVCLGWLLAPYWSSVVRNASPAENIILLVVAAAVILAGGKYLSKRFFKQKG